MPRDPYIREKFTKEVSAARQHAREYLRFYPKDRYETEVESWREIQSSNIEFTMKRLREPKAEMVSTLGLCSKRRDQSSCRARSYKHGGRQSVLNLDCDARNFLPATRQEKTRAGVNRSPLRSIERGR
jgi:hypothetical protein